MAKVRAAERERKRFAQDAKEMRQDARKISDGAQDFSRSIAAKRKEIHAGATTIVDQAKAIVEAGIGFQRDILRYCQEVGTFVNDFYFG